MKTLQILLALATPAIIAAGYAPENYSNYNALNINNIQLVNRTTTDDDGFRLNKQPYYHEMFNDKELSKLDKADKYRTKAEEATVLAVAIQKQADDLKIISGQSAKIQKQSAKLSAKAASQELTALKTFEKAASIYRQTYFDKIMQLSKDTSQASIKTARSLSERAYQLYHAADSIKAGITSENTLESNRAIYTNLVNAVHYQELALAVCKGDPKIDYTQYIDIHKQYIDTTKKVEIPKLVALERYDIDKDSNLYRLRYRQLTEKLPLTDADKKKIDKISLDEAAIADYFAKAVQKGSEADTFRVYSDVQNTAVHEYYEQKAQESELSECSNLIKGIKLATANNNTLYEIYKKYIPSIRIEKSNVGTYMDKSALGERWERNADDLFNLSKSYEELAAKQLSLVEQYTQLSEGNEAKLQALQYMENAIALYLGEKPERERRSLVSGAVERHNDVVMDYMMDESGESDTKPANNTTKPSNNAKKDSKPANQVVDVADNNKTNTSKTNTNKPVNTNTGGKTTPAKNTGSQTSNNASKTARTHTPDLASSNAAVIGTFSYTREDQRMKPYTFPQGTVFSVEAGIYKEMVEPVDFPTVSNFLAQNLKGITPMRYYIGTFQTYDAALAAAAIAKNEGYNKAQVVAFTNGKKVDLIAARRVAEKTANYQSLVQKELKTLNAGRDGNTPIVVDNNAKRTGDALPLSMLGSTVYAVQIAALPKLLGLDAFNVNELYYDQNDGGLYRYYTGISNDKNIASANLSTLRQSGYDDAYIVKVVNGVNIGSSSDKDKDVDTKKTSTGTVYRVQIGAFATTPNGDIQKRINNLKSNGYTVHTTQSGKYTVYTVGDCKTREQADALKRQLVGKGFKESYVATFVNGVKQN